MKTQIIPSKSTLILGLVAAFVAGGCSKPPGEEIVSGQVTYKGKPVTDVGIRFFEPTRGVGIVLDLDEEGNYVTPSPIPYGYYSVSLVGLPGPPKNPGDPPTPPVLPKYIDEAYRNASSSGLNVVVSGEEQVFNFEISVPPNRAKTRGRKGRTPPSRGKKA